jgi:hypothetical protein
VVANLDAAVVSAATRLVAWTVGAFLIAGVGIQAVRPARTNPPTDESRTLATRAPMPPHVSAIVNRACRDCHSNDTTWPWYSNVAPISWLLIDHVNHGRRHFNYSDFASYKDEDARRLLKNVCELTRKHEMPMGSYLLMHDEARLNDADVLALCEWSSVALGHVVETGSDREQH